VLGLGIAVTGTGFIVYYWIIAGAGASNGILAAYLIPAFALVYGAVLLEEPLTATGIGGFAVIATGVALGTGTVRRRSRSRHAEQGRRVLLEDVDEEGGGQPHDVEVVADDA
jgi:threonine/homoserine efflux transporter RhtA